MFSRIAAAYALLDGVRRLLVNLLFLLTLVTLAVVFWVASEAPNLPKGTLLRIDLVGEVKESGPAEPSFMLSMFGQDSFEENTRLADVVPEEIMTFWTMRIVIDCCRVFAESEKDFIFDEDLLETQEDMYYYAVMVLYNTYIAKKVEDADE